MSGDMIQLELTKALQREKDTGVPMQLIIEPEPLTESDTDDETFHPPPTTQPISREREPSTAK